MTTIVDQFEPDTRLLHLPGLTHLGVVEAHEGRRLGGVAEGELFRLAQRIAQPIDQGLERLGLIAWKYSSGVSSKHIHIAEHTGRRRMADADHLVRFALAAVRRA